MNKIGQVIGMFLLAVWCLCVFAGPSYAQVSADDLQKMENAMPTKAVAPPAKPRKMLVFNLCGPNGFRHSAIPYWDKALEIMGRKTAAFSVVESNDMAVFEPEKLKEFDAVCFNNTTRLKFDEPLQKSLTDFIKGGKGIVGIHAATDNFYEWPEAATMMGGQFSGHPWGGDGTWAIKIDEPNHPLMVSFQGKGFKIRDEIYRTKEPFYSRSQQLVLMSLDMTDDATRNAKGVTPEDMDTGIAWVKTWGKGRLFYCSLGHDHAVTWNPAVLQHYLAGIQFALGDLPVDTRPKPMISSGKGSQMDELMAKVKTYDWGQSREALTQVTDLARKAHGSPQEIARIEASMLEVLKSDATPAGKQFICRQLSIIGTEKSVPVLASMLANDQTADMARYALERIPGPAVDDALRSALSKTSGKARVGVINSLGQRKDQKAVAALGGLASDSDEMTAGAAVAALGQIANGEATGILAKAAAKASGKLQMPVLDAYLRCADHLAAEGKSAEAITIYKELQKKELPKPIQTAALRGMLNATKK